MKQLMLVIVLLSFLSSLSFAAIQDNLLFCIDNDIATVSGTNSTSITGTGSFTISGGGSLTATGGGLNEEGFLSTDNNDYLVGQRTNFLSGNQNFTVLVLSNHSDVDDASTFRQLFTYDLDLNHRGMAFGISKTAHPYMQYANAACDDTGVSQENTDETFVPGNTYFTIFTKNSTHLGYYVNESGGLKAWNSAATGGTLQTCGGEKAWIGARFGDLYDPNLQGIVDTVAYWNRSLTLVELQEVIDNNYDCSLILSGGVPPEPVVSNNFTIRLYDTYTNTAITNFSAEILGDKNYTTTNGLINTSILENDTSSYTIILNTDQWGGYFTETYSAYDVSVSLLGNITPYFYINSLDYDNYVGYSSLNYTRNLTYLVNLTCANGVGNNYLYLFINGTKTKTTSLTCNNATQIINLSYQSSTENHKEISLFLNTSFRQNYNHYWTRNQTFLYDVSDPKLVILNFTIPNGFFTNSETNVSLLCNDTISPILTYNLSLINSSGVNYLLFGNYTTGLLKHNLTNLTDGSVTARGVCSDFFSSNYSLTTRTVYTKLIFIIDEKDNTIFNVSNITSVIAYFDDNSTSYDFTANSRSNITFVSPNNDKLRFELTYPNGDIITRYIDVSLSDSNLRVCANKAGTTHYEQLIISATQKAVSLKNIYSNCIIAEDYTRFAYQDALVLKAYTISSLYGLYTYSSGQRVILASMDGSISTYYNIDVLQFKAQSFDFSVVGDTISFKKYDNTTIEIYYQNLRNDSIKTEVQITRLNTSEIVFSDTDTTSPNSFYMYFDFSTLSVSEKEIFRIDITVTESDGTVRTITRYFNTNASTGSISTVLAFVMALFLTIFGLSFTAMRLSLGWFGIFVQIISIAILSFAVSTWYSLILTVINVVILIFILLIMILESKQGGVIS